MPAHWEGGARTTSLLAAHFAKRNTKFGGGGTPEAIPLLRDATGQEARAGNPAKAGSKFSVRVFAKKSSDFIQRSELTVVD